jgi:hypothetical protein
MTRLGSQTRIAASHGAVKSPCWATVPTAGHAMRSLQAVWSHLSSSTVAHPGRKLCSSSSGAAEAEAHLGLGSDSSLRMWIWTSSSRRPPPAVSCASVPNTAKSRRMCRRRSPSRKSSAPLTWPDSARSPGWSASATATCGAPQ